MSDVKQCNKCKEDKQTTLFYKNSKSKDQLAASCKACQSSYNKAYRARKKQEKSEIQTPISPPEEPVLDPTQSVICD